MSAIPGDGELPDLTFIELEAIEVWQYKGVRCVVRPGFCSLNGYVCLPTSMRDWWSNYHEANEVLTAHWGLTYGPDEDGFIGFDTGHAFDYWAADDLIGLIPDEGMFTVSLLAKMHSDDRLGRRWTRARDCTPLSKSWLSR